MNIDDYFDTVEHSLRNAPHISSLREPVECLASDDHNHHKHIGVTEHTTPSDQPTLGQVLAEVALWLEQD